MLDLYNDVVLFEKYVLRNIFFVPVGDVLSLLCNFFDLTILVFIIIIIITTTTTTTVVIIVLVVVYLLFFFTVLTN
jgi:membrane protein YqaA with SNARE-associated domain